MKMKLILWFSIAKEETLSLVFAKKYFKASLHKDTKGYKWEEFQKVFIDRWINETKMKKMHKIQFELNKPKEKISKS